MKIRQGFVSNSSSSSFIIVAPTKIFNEKLNAATPIIKHVMTRYGHTDKLSGRSITYAFGHVNSDDEIYDFAGEIPNSENGDWPMTVDEAVLKFTGSFANGEAIIDWE